LRNRLEISALRPADLMVNYLVYPGTSGAHFYDYVVVDRVVVPPAEQARHYSEALLVLPATYQISFYDRHVAAAASGAGRGDDEWSYVAVLRRFVIAQSHSCLCSL
jgi:protein O-GlcNAc transferase